MPRTARSRTLAAPIADVWEVIADPHHLPRWWPRVQRVEDVRGGRWTNVYGTRRGRSVRADFELVESRRGRAVTWRQHVEDSPFERVLVEALTEVRLDKDGQDATKVTVELRQKLRGFARLAPFLVRRANRRLLDEALDGLETCTAR